MRKAIARCGQTRRLADAIRLALDERDRITDVQARGQTAGNGRGLRWRRPARRRIQYGDTHGEEGHHQADPTTSDMSVSWCNRVHLTILLLNTSRPCGDSNTGPLAQVAPESGDLLCRFTA